MDGSLLELALQRPLSHHLQRPEQQRANDRMLGLLDWNPSASEAAEYIKRRAAMGDEAMFSVFALSGGTIGTTEKK